MNENKKIRDIQVLRGVSIALVLLQHLSLSRTLIPDSITMPFYLGVETFFIISGYVITNLLFDASKPQSAISFLVRRIFRLYPALFLFFVISFLAGILSDYLSAGSGTNQIFQFDLAEFFRNALAILAGVFININKEIGLYSNGPMWSLSVEFQFYFVYAGLWLLLTPLMFRSHRRQIIAALALALFLLCCIQRGMLLFSVDGNRGGVLLIFSRYLINYKFDFLIAGLLLAAMNTFAHEAEFKPDLRMPEKMWLGFYGAVKAKMSSYHSGFLLLIPLTVGSHLSSPLAASMRQHELLEGFLMPLTLPCFAMLIFLAAQDKLFPRPFGRVFVFFEWLGEISYGVYIFHFPIMAFVWCLMYPVASRLINVSYSALSYGFWQFIISLPLILIFSALSFRYFEKPLNRYGKDLLKRFE